MPFLTQTELENTIDTNLSVGDRALIGVLRGEGGTSLKTVPTTGGVLAAEWHGQASTFPGLQSPAGYKLIATIRPGNTSPLEVTLGGQSYVVFNDGNPIVPMPPIRLDAGTKLLTLASSGLAQVVWHYEKIQPADGLLALWPDGALVDSVFGRTFTASGGDYDYIIGQYDEMQRNGNGAFTWLALVNPPTGAADLYLLQHDTDQQIVALHWSGDGSGTATIYDTMLSFDLGDNTPGPTLFAVTFDGINGKCFVNGVQIDAVMLTVGSATGDTALTRYDSSGATFGPFGMWNYAKTAAQVAAHGTGASPNFPTV